MPDYDAYKLPEGCHSTKCIGKIMPDPKDSVFIDKDILVPKGKVIKNQNKQARRTHNEYVVYSLDQVKLRYLVKVACR